MSNKRSLTKTGKRTPEPEPLSILAYERIDNNFSKGHYFGIETIIMTRHGIDFVNIKMIFECLGSRDRIDADDAASFTESEFCETLISDFLIDDDDVTVAIGSEHSRNVRGMYVHSELVMFIMVWHNPCLALELSRMVSDKCRLLSNSD